MPFGRSFRGTSTTSRSAISWSRTRRAASDAMKILGISGFDRFAAAALSVDGEIRAAACEESFARVPGIGYRFTGGCPGGAIGACLERSGVDLADLDRIVVVNDRADERREAADVHLRGDAGQ